MTGPERNHGGVARWVRRESASASSQRDTPGQGEYGQRSRVAASMASRLVGQGPLALPARERLARRLPPTKEGRRRRDIARGPGDRLRARAAREGSGGAGPAICDRPFVLHTGLDGECGVRVDL